jgi:hypothetical protein
MSTVWKPCDKLTASDFDTSPVWGFDLSREGKPEGVDETWVRPYSFSRVPDDTDVLFVSARLEPRGGEVLAGAVTIRFSDKRPDVQGVVLLDPAYCAMGLHQGVVPARERRYVETYLPNIQELFPLKYGAVLRIGDQDVALRGMAHLGW